MAAAQTFDIATPEQPKVTPATGQPMSKQAKRSAADITPNDSDLKIPAEGNPFDVRRDINIAMGKVMARLDEQEKTNKKFQDVLEAKVPIVDRLD